MPQFTVVARAQTGVRFPLGDALELRVSTELGPVDVLIQTRRAMMPGISRPVPRGLMATVRGEAPDLIAALPTFSRAGQSFLPVLTFAGNSPTEDFIPEIAWDSTPGKRERDFFQHQVAEDALLPIARRRLQSDFVLRLLNAIGAHPDSSFLGRALAQYHESLKNWDPGREILALAHLWMGLEALTRVTLRRVMRDEAVDRDGLALRWKVNRDNLDAEVRKRILLEGDADTYKRASEASNGFEHGFLELPELHADSVAVKGKLAAYLRQGIIRELNLTAADAAHLLSDPYATPGHTRFSKYLLGTITAETDDLAAPDEAYPVLYNWHTEYTEGAPLEGNPEGDGVTVDSNEKFTIRMAPGVKFQLRSIDVWAGQESALKRRPDFGTIRVEKASDAQ